MQISVFLGGSFRSQHSPGGTEGGTKGGQRVSRDGSGELAGARQPVSDAQRDRRKEAENRFVLSNLMRPERGRELRGNSPGIPQKPRENTGELENTVAAEIAVSHGTPQRTTHTNTQREPETQETQGNLETSISWERQRQWTSEQRTGMRPKRVFVAVLSCLWSPLACVRARGCFSAALLENPVFCAAGG